MTVPLRAAAVLAAGLLVASAQAGSSLRVIVSVVLSSGTCGASVSGASVSVSCGSFASLPALPPVGGFAGEGQNAFLGGSLGPAVLPFVGTTRLEQQQSDMPPGTPAQPAIDGGTAASDERGLRQVGVLPAWATGNSPMAVYSGGANLSSWRVVSNDNAQHVELTISW